MIRSCLSSASVLFGNQQRTRWMSGSSMVHLARCSSSSFAGDSGTTEIGHGHHLHSSTGRHSLIKTACGRVFDPNIYNEMVQACCDPKWMAAIQRGISEDKEYVEMLRTQGGAARTLDVITSGVKTDNEFMDKLKQVLTEDRKVALSLCALQESYKKLREKRDLNETKNVAEGKDPAGLLRPHTPSFGSNSLPG